MFRCCRTFSWIAVLLLTVSCHDNSGGDATSELASDSDYTLVVRGPGAIERVDWTVGVKAESVVRPQNPWTVTLTAASITPPLVLSVSGHRPPGEDASPMQCLILRDGVPVRARTASAAVFCQLTEYDSEPQLR